MAPEFRVFHLYLSPTGRPLSRNSNLVPKETDLLDHPAALLHFLPNGGKSRVINSGNGARRRFSAEPQKGVSRSPDVNAEYPRKKSLLELWFW